MLILYNELLLLLVSMVYQHNPALQNTSRDENNMMQQCKFICHFYRTTEWTAHSPVKCINIESLVFNQLWPVMAQGIQLGIVLLRN